MSSTPCYSPRLDEALALVTDAFRHKRRKSTEIPYLSHLMQVSVWVAERGGTENQIIAALLHDYLEDIEGSTADDLEASFGAEVAGIVVALSDATEIPKPPWKQRKLTYLEELRVEPPSVKLVSACDKLHNATCILRDLRTIGEAIWDRFSAEKAETLWYYRAVVEALGEGWDHPLVGELAAVVDTIHAETGA